MPKKTTSYQKLKAENQSLRNDIFNLVMNENYIIGTVTRLRYQVHYDLINSATGVLSSQDKETETFQGFASFVEAHTVDRKKNVLARFLTSPGLRVKNHLLCEKTKQKLNQLKNRIDGNHNS
jgi:hypothetical protein